MEVVLRAAYFDSGQVFGIAARVTSQPMGDQGHSIAFPTGTTPSQAASKLRELATWIEETANAAQRNPS